MQQAAGIDAGRALGQEPAYVIPADDNHEFGDHGLTKRELIAAMAMQGLLARGAMVSDRVASLAVTQSDALLAELAKDGAK